MAEQIRSFWSHLCGIFGAIFGMIAGGTLVTIEQADAVITGVSRCGGAIQNYSKETLSNGAVVYTCYGSGWLCARVDRKSAYPLCTSSNLDSNGECYVENTYDNYPRYYTYFIGCADGYYSTQGIGYSPNVNVSSSVSSSTAVLGDNLTTALNVTSTVAARKSVSGKTCYTVDNITFNTSAYLKDGNKEKNAFIKTGSFNDAYMQYPSYLTAGKCAKCPSFGEYAAASVGSTYAKNVSSCFMTSMVPRSDAADQPDGVATGQFIWTSTCSYDDTARLAENCYRMPLDGDCSLTVNSYMQSDKITAIKWVNEASGIGLNNAKALLEGSLPARATSAISCDRALCYLNAAKSANNIVTFSYNKNTTVTPTPGASATEIFDSVQRILYEDVLMDAEKDDITMDSDLYADLGMSELDIELLVNAIEDEFDVNVPYTVYTKWQTVRDVVDWIVQNLALSM